MTTTKSILIFIIILGLALLGYLFLWPGNTGTLPDSSDQAGGTPETLGTPSASFAEFESAIRAELGAELLEASDAGDDDTALAADQEVVTSLTAQTNDSNF